MRSVSLEVGGGGPAVGGHLVVVGVREGELM